MSTLGDLVDRLSICNTKLFHIQDQVHEAARQDSDVYAERAPEETQAIFRKLAALNLERNSLMTQIDECFADGVATGKVEMAARVKIL